MKKRLFLIPIGYFFLKALSWQPYFNLIINDWVIVLVLITIINILFPVRDWIRFCLVIFLLCIACVFLLFGVYGLAEKFGALAYIVLFFGIIHAIQYVR